MRQIPVQHDEPFKRVPTQDLSETEQQRRAEPFLVPPNGNVDLRPLPSSDLQLV